VSAKALRLERVRSTLVPERPAPGGPRRQWSVSCRCASALSVGVSEPGSAVTTAAARGPQNRTHVRMRRVGAREPPGHAPADQSAGVHTNATRPGNVGGYEAETSVRRADTSKASTRRRRATQDQTARPDRHFADRIVRRSWWKCGGDDRLHHHQHRPDQAERAQPVERSQGSGRASRPPGSARPARSRRPGGQLKHCKQFARWTGRSAWPPRTAGYSWTGRQTR
jgi:hypothetical protein